MLESRPCFPAKAATFWTRGRPRCLSINIPRNYETRWSRQSNVCERKRLGARGMRCASVFHAFTQFRRETAEAVIAAVDGMGLSGVKFAFLHVAEDHPFTLFDHSAPTVKGAYAPERGQAMELSDQEWLVALQGEARLKPLSRAFRIQFCSVYMRSRHSGT